MRKLLMLLAVIPIVAWAQFPGADRWADLRRVFDDVDTLSGDWPEQSQALADRIEPLIEELRATLAELEARTRALDTDQLPGSFRVIDANGRQVGEAVLNYSPLSATVLYEGAEGLMAIRLNSEYFESVMPAFFLQPDCGGEIYQDVDFNDLWPDLIPDDLIHRNGVAYRQNRTVEPVQFLAQSQILQDGTCINLGEGSVRFGRPMVPVINLSEFQPPFRITK